MYASAIPAIFLDSYSHLPPHEAACASHEGSANNVILTHYQPDATDAEIFTMALTHVVHSIRVLTMTPGDTRIYDPITHRFN